jgi:phospholipid transport system substrate-binding protein
MMLMSLRPLARVRWGVAWFAMLVAVPGSFAEAQAERMAQDPLGLVRSVSTEVLETLRSQNVLFQQDQNRLVALIEEKVAVNFDFRLIAAQVLGRHWRSAGEDQRQAFTTVFRALLINTYAAVFRKYDNQTVDILEVQETSSPDRVLVTTLVRQAGEQDIRVDYRLYRRELRWYIYDVVVDGISLLINYRSEYARVLQQQSLDGLIERLRQKNAEFAAG